MFAARPSGLVLTSAALIGASVIGVQLGESAISEINPIHFQGPLEPPRAVTPPPEAPPYDPYRRDYVWSLPPESTLAGCVGDCDTAQSARAVRLALDEPAGRDAALPYWRDATPATELRPWPPGEMPDTGLRLERYMRYPVNREQAEQAAVEATQGRSAAPKLIAAAAPAEALRVPPAMSEPVVEE